MNKPQIISLHTNGNSQMLYFTCSSLSADDRRIYIINDCTGNPNVYVHDLFTGEERMLTCNTRGILQSYVYFNGSRGRGLGKASICLDAGNDRIFYIQDHTICTVGLDGKIRILNQVPDGQMTAFTHVSGDGRYLCVPTTDARILEYDPDTEGYGLDQRPRYDIDARVQREKLNSYMHIYDTLTGDEIHRETVPHCWITHVQFHPTDNHIILYNNEWPSYDCGIRRMNLFDGKTHRQLRTVGQGRSADDWVCHEMWAPDGKHVIYHGAYANGPAFVGRVDVQKMIYSEIALPKAYDAYGHFTVAGNGNLVCDGYFKQPGDHPPQRENSTDHGADPHRKTAEYISRVIPDWEQRKLTWTPLCKHETDWLGQDAHPHAIYNHRGDRIFFSARRDQYIGVYSIAAQGET